MREAKPNLSVQTNRVSVNDPKTYHLPNWDGFNDPQKLATITQIIMQYGRDPRVAQVAVSIIREAGCKPREYVKQIKALLKFVQTQLYYVNEPAERLQSPLYTLRTGFGDCDDLAIVLCSFFECLCLPWKLVVSGQMPDGKLIRYHSGDKKYIKIPYGHIYCMVGNRPFTPTEWFYCEPTMDVPLGWDIVQVQTDPEARKHLPELGSYQGTASGTIGGAVAETVTEGRQEGTITKFGRQIILAIIVGSLTAVGTEILLDYIRGSETYERLISKRRRAV